MKIKLILTAAILLTGCGISVHAQDMTASTPPSHDDNWWNRQTEPGDLYQAYDISVEAFGLGTVNERNRDDYYGGHHYRQGQLGAGAGLEFFINRYIGIEAEGFSETTHNTFVNDAGGNLVFRWPIGQTGLAPYVFGGGGHEFYPVTDNNYADGGVGLEYRFVRWFGVFTDARFVATEHTHTYGLGRLGAKFTF
jgi:hypothetical protein